MLHRMADQVRRAGRYGDDALVHVNRRELGYLTREFGEPSRHPETGLPEFFDFGGFLKSVLPMAAPAILSAVAPGALGDIGGAILGSDSPWASTLGGGLVGGAAGLAANGFKNPLQNGLTGALMGAATPSLGKALGFDFQTPFNMPTVANLAGGLSGLGLGRGAAGAGANAIGSTSLAAPGDPANLARAGALNAFSNSAPSMGMNAAGSGGLSSNMWIPALALGALSLASGQGSGTSSAKPPPAPAQSTYVLPTTPYSRKQRVADNKSKRPGEYDFYADNALPMAAKGGAFTTGGALSTMARRVKGQGDARADKVPAMLSNKEYVMDGESMALLGNGDPDAGADRMDQMRSNLRKHKGRAMAKGKFSPDAKAPEGYLSAA